MENEKSSVITKANPHTIKKFKLIEKYITEWAQKLANFDNCHTLVFMDCMCNSGVYIDDEGKIVDGTAIRVMRILADIAEHYPEKKVEIYFNDLNKERIEELKKHLPKNTRNLEIIVNDGDVGQYLRVTGPQLYNSKYLHYFLLYDPYDASIDWEALLPFFRNWGEVLINHMVSDPVRAIRSVKHAAAKEKYKQTYLAEFEELLPFGSSRQAYEERVRQIIESMKGEHKCYVASFPFFNSVNSLVYNLVHYTSSIEGFKLYKKCAWQVFGGRSSGKKDTHGSQCQMAFNFDENSDDPLIAETDEECFSLRDIAEFLRKKFKGRQHVFLDELWGALENHPVFPSDGFRDEIKKELIDVYSVRTERTVDSRSGKKKKHYLSDKKVGRYRVQCW